MKRHRGSGTYDCFRERKECKRLAEQQFQPSDISVYGEKVEWVDMCGRTIFELSSRGGVRRCERGMH